MCPKNQLLCTFQKDPYRKVHKETGTRICICGNRKIARIIISGHKMNQMYTMECSTEVRRKYYKQMDLTTQF